MDANNIMFVLQRLDIFVNDVLGVVVDTIVQVEEGGDVIVNPTVSQTYCNADVRHHVVHEHEIAINIDLSFFIYLLSLTGTTP